MDDAAQMVMILEVGKLEQTYPSGINNKWNNSNIYKKSVTKKSQNKIRNAVENTKQIL